MTTRDHAPLRVLVTGGAGFIGRHVVAEFLRRGATVATLDDLSTGDRSAVPGDVELLQHDIADPRVAHVVDRWQPTVVVHAAAQTSVAVSVADPERDRAVNVVGTRNVASGAAEAGARLVFLSSGGAIYGNSDGADEATPPAPESPYGRHKLEAEEALATIAPSHANLRLANVYGPGQRTDGEGGVVAIFVDRLRRGLPIELHGDGQQRRDFVHVADVVAAVGLASTAEVNGTWNVGTGSTTSIAELVQRLETLLDIEAEVVRRPSRAGDVTTSRLLVDRIERELGWRPAVSLEAGLEDLLADRAVQ